MIFLKINVSIVEIYKRICPFYADFWFSWFITTTFKSGKSVDETQYILMVIFR